MLKVEIGYYDFIFPDDTPGTALQFAQIAREHIAKDDKKVRVLISFEDDEDKEEES